MTIPSLPSSCSDEDALRFYRDILTRIEGQSQVHERWFTHKGNPSVCWICDLIMLTTYVLGESERILSKSSLDIETSKDQETNSEVEIDT